ncbi:MAG: type IV pilus secretin PilQ [Elusimicrobia bacterium]|nr:type IV pilus secretin PilQ [Candidatus Liberimonas magnetica]
MKKIAIELGIIGSFLMLFTGLSPAQEGFKTLNNIRVDGNSVIISLSGKTKYNAFKMTNPPKLIVEFSNTEHNFKEKDLAVNKSTIKRIRSGQFKNAPVKVARVVIDLSAMMEFELKSEGNDVKISFNPDTKASEVKEDQAKKTQVVPVLAQAAPVPLKPAAVPGVQTQQNQAPAQTAQTPITPAAVTPSQTQQNQSPAQGLNQQTQKTPEQQKKPEETKPAQANPETPVPKPSEVKAVPATAVPKEFQKIQKQKNDNQSKQIKQVRAKREKQAGKVNDPVKASESKLVLLPKIPVTLDFEDADIRDVLRVLSMKSGINIIFSDDVKGNVTLHLENVPFDKALETILSLNGLVSQEQGPNILRIATPQKIAEERSQAVTFTKIFPLNYAKAEDVKANLDSVRSAEGRRGNVSVDARTNSLVVTDTPDGLVSVERLMSQLDKKPQQVLIEAKIVEITLTDSYDMGIQWQYAGTPVNNDTTRVDVGQSAAAAGAAGFGAGAAGLAQRNVSGITAGGTGVNFPAAPAAGQAGSIAFGIVANNNYLTGALTALAQKGLSKTLSTPRVTTINNQEAKILVGQKVPYTSAQTQSSIGQTTSTEFLDVGIKLTVVPTVNIDNKITLFVHPEVSLFVRADPAGPVLGTREAKTTVLVENGETVVIGGLITEEDRKLGTQVPLLGDLPIIGHLFRRDFKSKDRTELLVFITPKILD